MTQNNTLFVIFILGALAASLYFIFFQPSDRRVLTDTQLDQVEQRISDVETIYTGCITFARSRENTPESVRAQCVESRDFVSWARSFPSDPALKKVRAELIILANTVEEMTSALSLHPNSTYGKQLLDQVPAMMEKVRDEASRARKKFIL